MLNNSRVIGFIGTDKYDIIHYLSRILKNLGYKVLLVDHSESKALKNSITLPAGINCSENIIEYRSVDFVHGMKLDEKMLECYDYILMDFGFELFHVELNQCTDIVYVTDLQRHNLGRIIGFKGKIIYKYLVIREVVRSKIGNDYAMTVVQELKIMKDNYFIVNQDNIDTQVMIECQYSNIFKFGKISQSLKDMLINLMYLMTENNEKEIKKAYRRSERGI